MKILNNTSIFQYQFNYDISSFHTDYLLIFTCDANNSDSFEVSDFNIWGMLFETIIISYCILSKNFNRHYQLCVLILLRRGISYRTYKIRIYMSSNFAMYYYLPSSAK